MDVAKLTEITRHFDQTVGALLKQQGSDRGWLKGVGEMVQSKMNLDLILEDMNLFSTYVPNGPILDFGAGSGYVSLLLASMGYQTKAVDIDNYSVYSQNTYNKAMVEDQQRLWFELSKNLKNLSFSHYASTLPYKTEEFNAVMAYAVLEHIPDSMIGGTLSEIRRVLKPQGLLYISRLPRKKSASEYLARHLHLGCHERLYKDSEARELLTKAGFGIVAEHYEEVLPAYPEALTNALFPVLKPLNKLLLKTPLKLISHHLRFICQKI